MHDLNYNSPEYFINRELSWLEFNDRVLDEARDNNNPLLERVKFLAITSSNLDEFFMIRVALLKEQIIANYSKPDHTEMTPKQQLKLISLRAHTMVETQYSTLNRSLIPALAKQGIDFINGKDINKQQRSFLEEYFINVIYPVLTPMAVDSRRPFPLILNMSLNIGVFLKHKKEGEEYVFVNVQVPSMLPRLIELPQSAGRNERCFIFLEEIIMIFIDRLFTKRDIICAYPYRITRNADLAVEEEEAQDLLREIEKSLKKRNWGMAIRLEVHHSMDERMMNLLKSALEIHSRDIYFIKGPLDPSCFMKLSALDGYEHLMYKHYEPQTVPDFYEKEDYFEIIRERDIFLHHPYESFDPVVEFIKQASKDPSVLAIKQTLYRISGDSPIITALEEAASAGKQVMVLLEVRARFDEENNISWAKSLEQAGCHVIYGFVGLKTHCKITLVVRMEESGIRRYMHLSTGNYNDMTARLYTDMGLFTANEYFGADASALFNMLSGYSEPPQWHKFEAAPLGLRAKFLYLIENEIQNALSGKKAVILAKMNSLEDDELISAFYRASLAGVKIKLIIRGICCLKPGLKGLSENISVISIVGRFLEHSRIFYFYNNGRGDLFLSSADLMPRNLDRRIELLFPIEDGSIKEKIIDILKVELEDTEKARILESSGKYKRVDKRGKKRLNSQEYLCGLAVEAAKRYDINKPSPEFEAIHSGK